MFLRAFFVQITLFALIKAILAQMLPYPALVIAAARPVKITILLVVKVKNVPKSVTDL